MDLSARFALDLGQFRFGGGEFPFEGFQLVGIVHLFLRPGQLLAKLLDSLVERLDLFFGFLVHGWFSGV